MVRAPDITFHAMLADAANLILGFAYIDDGDIIPAGEDIPDDGSPADAIDEEYGEWRVKIEERPGVYAITRHLILR